MKHSICTAVILCLGLAANSYACEKPSQPALPNPSTAVTPEMVKAKNDIKQYMADAEAYLGCVKSSRKHNAMIDEMHLTADTFNNIIREYKERMNNA